MDNRPGTLSILAFVSATLLASCGVSSFRNVSPGTDYSSTGTGDSTPGDGGAGTSVGEGPNPIVDQPNPITKPNPAVEPGTGDQVVPDTTLYFDRNAKNAGEQHVTRGALHLKVDAAVLESKTETTVEKPPLSIMFAIDRSSSMGRELSVVKQGIEKFSDNLIKSGFSAEFGALAFQDSVDHFHPPGTFDSFQSYINRVTLASPNGNQDIPEGSLAALNQAYAMLESKVTDPNVVPVIVLLTDAIGHQGGSGTDILSRNCSSASFLSNIKSEFGKRVVFFHGSSDLFPRVTAGFRARCPWNKVSDQYNEILAAIKGTTPMVFRGEALSWPFDESVLTSQLPNILVTKLMQKNVSCEVTGAELLIDNASVKLWSQTEIKADAAGTILLPEGFSAGRSPSFEGKSVALKVSRCCEKNADSSCKTPKDQLVDFSLKLKP